MKALHLSILILLTAAISQRIPAQTINLGIYTMGAEFLLDKTKIDPEIVKIIERVLPKAINRDIEGALSELTSALYEKKNVQVLNPEYINYARNKITNLSKSLTEQNYFDITMGLSDFILVTDNYVKNNVVPDKTFLNTNKIANKAVDSTSINKTLKAVKVNHEALLEVLKNINQENQKINCIAFTSFGGYTVLYGANGFASLGIPQNATEKLKELHDANNEIKQIAYSPTGGYVILYGLNGFVTSSVNPQLEEKLVELNRKGSTIENVCFSPEGGFVIIFDKSGFASTKIPESLYNKLKEINSKNLEIKNISFEEDGGYVVNYGKNGFISSGVAKSTSDKLTELNQNQNTIDFVSFITGGGHVIVYNNTGYSYRGAK